MFDNIGIKSDINLPINGVLTCTSTSKQYRTNVTISSIYRYTDDEDPDIDVFELRGTWGGSPKLGEYDGFSAQIGHIYDAYYLNIYSPFRLGSWLRVLHDIEGVSKTEDGYIFIRVKAN